MKRTITLISLLFSTLFNLHHVLAQSTTANLAVKRELEENPAIVLKAIAQTAADTNRVNLLNKVAHVFWHQRTTENHGQDSCFIYARQAYDLSRKLNFTTGNNEASFLLCKVYTKKENINSALGLARQAYGEQRVRLLLTIAEHFVFDFDTKQNEFQQGPVLISEAKKTAIEAKSDRWMDECHVLEGKYYFKLGNLAKGKAAFMQIIIAAHQTNNYAREAEAWSSLGMRMPDDNNNYRDIIYYHEQAVKYYMLAGRKKDAAYSLRDLATINGNYTATDSAENQLLRSVALLKSINEKITITTYTLLADFYRLNGKYDKALYFAFEALKVKGDVEQKKMITYIVLGRVYHILKSYQNSLKYYQIVFKFAEERDSPYQYMLANDIANVEAEGGNPKKAIAFLSAFVKKHALPLFNYKQITACTFADIYNRMGDYQKAERYYLEMLSYNDAVKDENRKNLDKIETTFSGNAGYYKIGKFYTERKNFKKAKEYLTLSLNGHQYVDAEEIIDTDHLLFKADSALGNYMAAIQHFQRYKALSDSVNSVAKNKQINELNIKYETAQRLKDIKTLQNKELKQQAKLEQAGIIRNIILGGAALLLVLALIAFKAYRSKQKTNKELTAQRQEIKNQYRTLQDLLAEKDNFLREKDWLLKEIHHRVKNNLQIVMSLLSTQSAYLKSEDAIEAILESENRVQSIALIHQKLYSSDNPASISMPDYVSDLALQLSQAFDTSKRNIRFKLLVEDIYVDLSQAVPLGLILNEAITNSIKYAFDAGGGQITIGFKRTDLDNVVLTIADNGVGMPPDFDILASKSLGMEMMHGLSGQLRGAFHISNHSGTAIQITFKLTPTLLKVLTA
ncbi:tetratricopeptide repeat-containing sensor histidine kinase [Mucilaginibacter rubeus]|uniref:tetratricopeptide repeat-containing sensor histidine kinase n=1 Tax=Mucilaginibacter rubeus TaxID=2027860 RepID=UPI001666CEF8|nr:sensor histidine kinase [Mucilaginibacter rubeus]GGA96270.1 hypothetical protein GCM10011500_10090 [Mucilaginibacter rubeus]